MNPKNRETDSGSYVNGVYTTKNGFAGTGLNCPKGTRLYDTSKRSPFIMLPPDVGATEHFTLLTQEVAPDVLPYYAISNYGRVMNMNSGLIMKPNYRPNGYEYLCLAADNCKHGQKKYTTHQLVMKTFKPIINDTDEVIEVNHINGVKADNYVDKTMPDGSIQSNLEWTTKAKNIEHRNEMYKNQARTITYENAQRIREMHDQGYSYEQIQRKEFPNLNGSTIARICKNLVHVDPTYTPVYGQNTKDNPAGIHKLVDRDVEIIRSLYKNGYNCTEIVNNFYPNFSKSTISDVVRRISHNNI